MMKLVMFVVVMLLLFSTVPAFAPQVSAAPLVDKAAETLQKSPSDIIPGVVKTRQVLAILIASPDLVHGSSHTVTYYQNLLFGGTFGALNDYYSEVSYGRLKVTGTIAGLKWYGANEYMTWWGANLPPGYDNLNADIQELAREAVLLADADVDFSVYDTNNDNIIEADELSLCIVHAGSAEETSTQTYDIWSHRSIVFGEGYSSSVTGFPYSDTFVDGCRISSHPTDNAAGYMMEAEGSPMGIFAHELGHDLGLPDLYSYADGKPVVDAWSLMDQGCWDGTAIPGDTPAHLDPWSKVKLGWVSPIVVDNYLGSVTLAINQAETNNERSLYRVDVPNTNNQEYFLIENRMRVKYDSALPYRGGVLIWHIDENMPDNTQGPYYKIALEQPGGTGPDIYGNLPGSPNYRGAFDTAAYTSDAGRTAFTGYTTPSSTSNNGGATNISIWQIGPRDPVMAATIGQAIPGSGAVGGTFTMTGGSATGTYDAATGKWLGSANVTISIAGDIVASGFFNFTSNDAEVAWYGSSQPLSTSPPGTAILRGTASNFSFSTGPPAGPLIGWFDVALAGSAWTTDGSNQFLRLTMSGSGSGIWTQPNPNLVVWTDVSASGTWTGTQSTITTSAQAQQVTQSGPGIAPLSDPLGRAVAELLYDTASSSGIFVLGQYVNNPDGPPVNLPLGKFVAADTNIISALINWPVELRIYYTDAEVAAAGINENTLGLYRWDGSNWVQVADSGVNTVENYVWGNLDSFSDYGAMGYPAGCDQVSSATGTGTVTLCQAAGTFANLSAARESSIPATGKPSLIFPHGFFKFDITGLTNGESVTLTISLPSAVPTTASYWKYGPTPTDPLNSTWYQIPMGSNDGDNVITITLTDGGWGDDVCGTGTEDGMIIDQGGPGWPGPFGAGGGGVPIFPSIYIGIGAAFGAGILAYFMRKRLATHRAD